MDVAHPRPGTALQVNAPMKRSLRRMGLWVLCCSAVVLALLILFIMATPQGRTGLNTVLFVTQVLDLPIKPQSWVTDEPLRHRVEHGLDGPHVAEVYRLPGDETRAAVLLSVGATTEGLDNPAVVTLGDALARAGYVAMLHWSPAMGLESNMDPSEVTALVEAFVYLEGLEYVDPERVGIGGFCIGASLALVAAADPEIRDRVGFVNAFGPFYDAGALLRQTVSRTVVYDGETTPWQPNPRTLLFLTNELIENLDDPSDVQMLTRHYLDDQPSSTIEPDRLSPQGKIVARLLNGVRPHEAEALYEMLPPSLHEDLAMISPSAYVHGLRARLLVMHDRYDEYIPVSESRRLLEATEDRLDVYYTEFIAFDHLLPEDDGILSQLREAYVTYRHMYSILRIAA